MCCSASHQRRARNLVFLQSTAPGPGFHPLTCKHLQHGSAKLTWKLPSASSRHKADASHGECSAASYPPPKGQLIALAFGIVTRETDERACVRRTRRLGRASSSAGIRGA
eukprot:scaffold5465_cov34-Phaeocystis_antarctica.AAC.2